MYNQITDSQKYLFPLTHRGRNKMAISHTTFSSAFSWMKTFEFEMKFHWNMFHYGLNDTMAALVQIMAWRRTGDDPFSEAMLICCTDQYMPHSASMSYPAVWILLGKQITQYLRNQYVVAFPGGYVIFTCFMCCVYYNYKLTLTKDSTTAYIKSG